MVETYKLTPLFDSANTPDILSQRQKAQVAAKNGQLQQKKPQQQSTNAILKKQLADYNNAEDIERPLAEKKGLDFNKFKAHLLNTNHIVEELPELRFLDGLEKEDLQDGVVMSSYPRSGNTLLRSYLEKITGLVTGSDTDISHGLNKALLNAGLQGEGLVDKRVWVIKTHYPERYGGT